MNQALPEQFEFIFLPPVGSSVTWIGFKDAKIRGVVISREDYCKQWWTIKNPGTDRESREPVTWPDAWDDQVPVQIEWRGTNKNDGGPNPRTVHWSRLTQD